MDTIAFTDGTQIGVYRDGKTMKRESNFILGYRENLRRINDNNAWKYEGAGYRFREGTHGVYNENSTTAFLNAVTFTDRESTVAYSFTVGESSGIYYKNFSLQRNDESHLIHSNSTEFLSLSNDKKEGDMLATIRKNGDVRFSVARFGRDGDYVTLTEGDSKDENASYSQRDGKILFDSAGVGRDGSDNFVMYGNAAIYTLDPLTLAVDELHSAADFSYIKPKEDKEGNVYAVKRPLKNKIRRNILLEIILIPVRIIEAIVGFVQFFVKIFAQKPLVESKGGNTGGNNPAWEKSRDYKEVYVEGMLIEADKELKRNARSKEKDLGFIPRSWQLVKIAPDGRETVLKNGVADYALGEDGVYCTDGKHVHRVSYDGTERKKLFDTEFCLHLDVK